MLVKNEELVMCPRLRAGGGDRSGRGNCLGKRERQPARPWETAREHTGLEEGGSGERRTRGRRRDRSEAESGPRDSSAGTQQPSKVAKLS